jgi:hypothetical protein
LRAQRKQDEAETVSYLRGRLRVFCPDIPTKGIFTMGIDIHGLNFLKFASRKQAFGRVATIGRQEIHVSIGKLKSALNLTEYTKYGPYCEELLIGHFAATVVESFDNSDYEQATYIADMNKPLTLQNRYDIVIDVGSLSMSITFLKH